MLKYFLDNKRGQALTEFVIIIPVFFLLIFGIIQMSLLYSSYIVVNHAAYIGARAGVVGGKYGDAAKKICSPLINGSDVIVQRDYAGNDLKVTVTYRMPIIFPFIGKALGRKAILVRATCRMRMER